MRRGNRSDMVVRPKRPQETVSKKAPTLAELATRVTWLEECQRANVETVEVLKAQLGTVTDRLAGVEWRQKYGDATPNFRAAQLAASAMSAINLSAKSVAPRADLSSRFEGLGTVNDASDDPTPLIRAAFNKTSLVLLIAALCVLGIAGLLLWWPWI